MRPGGAFFKRPPKRRVRARGLQEMPRNPQFCRPGLLTGQLSKHPVSSPPAVVPHAALRTVLHEALRGEYRAQENGQQFAERVELGFARRSDQRRLAQNDEAQAALAGVFLQAPAQVQFLAREEREVEAANFAERRRFAENKRAGGPFRQATEEIPTSGEEVEPKMRLVQFDRRTTADAAPALNLFG